MANSPDYEYLVPRKEPEPLLIPQSTTPKPRSRTLKPIYSIPKPQFTTPKPQSITLKPISSIPKPQCTTPKPQSITLKPTYSIPKPQSTTQKPQSITLKPIYNIPKPQSTTPKPQSKTLKPISSIAKPQSTTPKPQSRTPKPISSIPKPQFNTPKSRSKSLKPIYSTSKPQSLLFLTDSFLKNFPVEQFPINIKFLKRVVLDMYNINEYEHLFSDFKIIFISCGVYDLYRELDKYNAINLIGFLRSRLNFWKQNYPGIEFVINSLILTKFDWLNKEIETYNRMLLHLVLEHYQDNVYIFDSWEIARKMWSKNINILNPKGNGVQIHHRVSSEMHCSILKSMTNLIMDSDPSLRDCWPLRDSFREVVKNLKDTRQL